MTSTLGFTGMDRNTQAELTQAFSQAVGRLGLDLRLVENGEADIVVVDMDSLYGPMSWMQLHNAGRKVIGYTSSPRTQTDYRLDRPADANALDALLKELGIGTAQAPKPVVAPAAEAAKPAAPAAKPAPASKPAAATPHGLTPAPAPADVLPEEAPSPAPAEVLATPAIQPEPLPARVPARDPVLADWLQAGRLSKRVRYQRDGGPALLIDGAAGQYHGPAILKPLEGYFEGTVSESDFKAVDDATWQAEAGGQAQPLSRLAWYGGLLEGKGALLPHLDADGRYRLTKWLQTEREFPKHFRIATAMMKGPATVQEIAVAANVSAAEVADFINAGLASGLTEQVLPEPPPVAEPPRSGLFGLKRR